MLYIGGMINSCIIYLAAVSIYYSKGLPLLPSLDVLCLSPLLSVHFYNIFYELFACFVQSLFYCISHLICLFIVNLEKSSRELERDGKGGKKGKGENASSIGYRQPVTVLGHSPESPFSAPQPFV